MVKDSASQPAPLRHLRPQGRRRPGPSTRPTPSTWPPSPTASATPARRAASPRPSTSPTWAPPSTPATPPARSPASEALQHALRLVQRQRRHQPARRAGAPAIPGVNTRIGDPLKSPNVPRVHARRDAPAGGARLGAPGRRLPQVPRLLQPRASTAPPARSRTRSAGASTCGLIENTNDLERSYQGMNSRSATGRRPARPRRQLHAGRAQGQRRGENGGSGPTTATSPIIRYPEYYRPAWNFTVGEPQRGRAPQGAPVGDLDVPVPDGGRKRHPRGLSVLQQRNALRAPGHRRHAAVTSGTRSATPPAGHGQLLLQAARRIPHGRLWRTDLAVNWAHRLGLRNTEVFLRAVILNVFNRTPLTNFFDLGCGTGGCINTTVLTNRQRSQRSRPSTRSPTSRSRAELAQGPTFGTAHQPLRVPDAADVRLLGGLPLLNPPAKPSWPRGSLPGLFSCAAKADAG